MQRLSCNPRIDTEYKFLIPGLTRDLLELQEILAFAGKRKQLNFHVKKRISYRACKMQNSLRTLFHLSTFPLFHFSIIHL